MKIAYDISILGQGYVNPKARTGVYRVVESVFLELLKQQDINLTAIDLNGLSNIWDSTSTNLYIDNLYPQLEKHFDSCYYSRLHLHPFYKMAVNFQRDLIETSLEKLSWLYKPAIALQVPFKILGNLEVICKFNDEKFNLYHSPFYSIPSIPSLSTIPKILTVYDMIPVIYTKMFTNTIYRKFIKIINSINCQKDWIICISEHTKKDFCEYTGMNPERVFVTPLAAANHFYPINNLEIINSTLKRYQIAKSPYLLSLCTLEPRKNLSFLIRCFSQIIADNPSLDINLVLVGVSGWKNSDIFQAASENPLLKSRIIFTGYVPDEDLSAIYSGATAFVYPSLYEGFGLPPLEAMQCGTPVITSNTSSLPEVIGDAGIMIDPQQEDELCQAILNSINNSQLRTTLSQKGIQRASQFSWARCAEETVKIYRIASSS